MKYYVFIWVVYSCVARRCKRVVVLAEFDRSIKQRGRRGSGSRASRQGRKTGRAPRLKSLLRRVRRPRTRGGASGGRQRRKGRSPTRRRRRDARGWACRQRTSSSSRRSTPWRSPGGGGGAPDVVSPGGEPASPRTRRRSGYDPGHLQRLPGENGAVHAQRHREAVFTGSGARSAGEEAGERHAPLHAGAPHGAVPHLRAQRMRVLHHQDHHHLPPPTRPRQSPQHSRHRQSYMDRSCEENAKIVEMDIGEPVRRGAAKDRNLLAEHDGRCYSPAPSAAATELMSPTRAYRGHFDEFSVASATARSSPQQGGSEACPSYMANTESSRGKARSQSAPRQRTDSLERQPSRRKGTPPRCAARMQRSSSLAGATPRGGGQASPWSVGLRLDASTAWLKDSECGSTSSVLTAATVYSRTRSLIRFEVRRGLY
ncbi:unnamed protein product [Urochloa humidicola]